MAKKKATAAAKKHAAKKPTSTAPKKVKSKKATKNLAPLLAPPADQAKLTPPGGKRSKKQATLAKTHGMAIQGHISSRGRANQAARDVRNAPRKRTRG